ncbi:four helix bundle protein [Spirosoma flavum]|uniref:Four helix bundle protein n=1 Tax=Spirosoma flavum TaxID=2048557 RepID=A0ABW6AL36_9BACT
MHEKESIIQVKSFEFSVRVIRMYQWLCKEHRIYSLADQVLRSGTGIGSNVEEASGGLTKKEFTAKIGIAYKEARETRYWLRLLGTTDYLDKKTFESMLSDCEELVKILGSIQKTAQANLLKEKLELRVKNVE